MQECQVNLSGVKPEEWFEHGGFSRFPTEWLIKPEPPSVALWEELPPARRGPVEVRELFAEEAQLLYQLLHSYDLSIGPGAEGPAQSEAVAPEVEREFRAHVERWRRETLVYSSIARKIAHPDYLAIIGMQKKVVPLLLRELAERPSYWFAALKALAKDEQPPGETSNFDAAVKAWLDWGRKRGYLQERSAD